MADVGRTPAERQAPQRRNSGLDQTCGKEPIHTASLWPHARMCAQKTASCQCLRERRKLCVGEWLVSQAATCQRSIDTRHSLLRLQRAYFVDKAATRAKHRAG